VIRMICDDVVGWNNQYLSHTYGGTIISSDIKNITITTHYNTLV
jgi:hypothetical protein